MAELNYAHWRGKPVIYVNVGSGARHKPNEHGEGLTPKGCDGWDVTCYDWGVADRMKPTDRNRAGLHIQMLARNPFKIDCRTEDKVAARTGGQGIAAVAETLDMLFSSNSVMWNLKDRNPSGAPPARIGPSKLASGVRGVGEEPTTMAEPAPLPAGAAAAPAAPVAPLAYAAAAAAAPAAQPSFFPYSGAAAAAAPAVSAVGGLGGYSGFGAAAAAPAAAPAPVSGGGFAFAPPPAHPSGGGGNALLQL